jgi:Rrf2 family protein
MKFSKKSEYGLRALIELTATHGGQPLRRKQIAERQNIPVVFLEQILLALKHAGLLASTRGASGGYALIKPPAKVTLGRVIRTLDGPLAPIACVSKTAYQKCHDCPYARKRYCPLQDVMGEVRNAIADILDNYTLEGFTSRMRTPRRRKRKKAPRRKTRSRG